jgi:putative transposase
MARQARIDHPGSYHHTMNRGARHQEIFGDDGDRRKFLALLGTGHRRFNVDVHAFCLMGNHFHVLLHSPDGRLSDFMQYMGVVYTQYFNRKYDFDGPLFRGRFHSEHVDTDEYMLEACRYIHRNPDDIRDAPALGAYRWSSHRIYLGCRPSPGWLTTDLIAGMFGNDVECYRRYVEQDRHGETARPILGSVWLDDGTDHASAQPADRDTGSSLEELDHRVMALTGTDGDDLRVARKGRPNLARLLVLLVGFEDVGANPRELAERYGFHNRNGVWSAILRARERVASDAQFRILRDAARPG